MIDALPHILYHYTTDAALKSIVNSLELRPSLIGQRLRDVRYGEGQYLTDMQPGRMTGAQISRLLLGHPFQGHRFTHFLRIDVAGISVHYGRPGVYVILNREALDLRGRIVSTGRNAP